MKKLASILFLVLIIYIVPAWGETGYASWYGGKFNGRQTASGEIFDTNKMTAAHKTLPFGTLVKVTNLNNGESVQVRINDRGPFVEGRIIDLSRAAAAHIGMMSTGIAPVKVEIISTPANEANEEKNGNINSSGSRELSYYSIQVGSFSARENAQRLLSQLNRKGMEPEYEDSGNGHTRVVLQKVGPAELDPLLTKLAVLGYNSVLVRRHFAPN